MRALKAFTMIELIFVIIIMGILGKFGVELLSQAYSNYIFSNINNQLQSKSATVVEFISKRLQNRINDSTIARKADVIDPDSTTNFELLSSATGDDYTILEWVGVDVDGFRGDYTPFWSGIIDLDSSRASVTTLVSPQTNTTKINTLIDTLSDGNATIEDAALYFLGANTDKFGYGWDGVAITDQSKVMHPIKASTTDEELFVSGVGDFSGVSISEYYKLSWSAYAVVLDTTTHELKFYYDYQPWLGESYSDASTKSTLLMQDVDTFRFMAIGSLIKIQICTSTNLLEEYSLCKEKTVY